MANRNAFESRRGLLPLLALLFLMPVVVWAQQDPAPDDEILDIERQIDSGSIEDIDATEAIPEENSELWEEYKRYRSPDGDEGEYRVSAERVEIGGSIVVREGELIEGDVVAVGGQVTVHGRVEGDVVAVGGSIRLDEGAVVDGDAVAVGGRVFGPGEVSGERVSVDIPLPFVGGWHVGNDIDIDYQPPRALGLWFILAFFLIGLLFAFLLNLIAEKRLDVTSRRIDAEPGMSFLIGLLAAIGTPVALLLVTLLLAVTVILLILPPFLAFGLWILSFAGFVAVSIAVGRRAAHLRDADDLPRARSPYFYILIGFVVLHAFTILGGFFGAIGGVLAPIGTLFWFLGGFVLVFASVLGYGALFTSRLGTQPVGGGPPPAAGWAPTPPPPPPGTSPPPPPPPPPPPGSVSDARVGLVGEMPERPKPPDE